LDFGQFLENEPGIGSHKFQASAKYRLPDWQLLRDEIGANRFAERRLEMRPECLAALGKAFEFLAFYWRSIEQSWHYFVRRFIDVLDSNHDPPDLDRISSLDTRETTFGTTIEPARCEMQWTCAPPSINCAVARGTFCHCGRMW